MNLDTIWATPPQVLWVFVPVRGTKEEEEAEEEEAEEGEEEEEEAEEGEEEEEERIGRGRRRG